MRFQSAIAHQYIGDRNHHIHIDDIREICGHRHRC